jgi:hypothetical protein
MKIHLYILDKAIIKCNLIQFFSIKWILFIIENQNNWRENMNQKKKKIFTFSLKNRIKKILK